jgi:hypothetical protein
MTRHENECDFTNYVHPATQTETIPTVVHNGVTLDMDRAMDLLDTLRARSGDFCVLASKESRAAAQAEYDALDATVTAVLCA